MYDLARKLCESPRDPELARKGDPRAGRARQDDPRGQLENSRIAPGNLLRKLKLRSSLELVHYALSHGLIAF
jgi:hypothetical protein